MQKIQNNYTPCIQTLFTQSVCRLSKWLPIEYEMCSHVRQLNNFHCEAFDAGEKTFLSTKKVGSKVSEKNREKEMTFCLQPFQQWIHPVHVPHFSRSVLTHALHTFLDAIRGLMPREVQELAINPHFVHLVGCHPRTVQVIWWLLHITWIHGLCEGKSMS